ncbi:MAG: hypothetical protein LBS89_08925 [Zoogloeaceae bacterium]|jgi:hypothetical protein|nr:hypothetical protein [Zoogloeaceae bacterium]
MDWVTLKDEIYYEDGSLRDVVVIDTTPSDWQKLIDFFNESCPLEWWQSHEKDAPSAHRIDFGAILACWDKSEAAQSLATLRVGKVTLNVHFFVADEIELDIDPREFKSMTDHERLLEFLLGISSCLDKPVLLLPEGSRDKTPLITVFPRKSP